MLTKLKQYPRAGPRVFIDPAGYKEFVDGAQETFRKAFNKQEAAAALSVVDPKVSVVGPAS
jgi:metallo-beta-lactamase class B